MGFLDRTSGAPSLTVVFVTLLALSAAAVLVTPTEVRGASASWTFMVYIDGDNNLEPAAVDDFLELSSVGSTADVNIVVQMDRWDGFPKPDDDTRYGDWQDCKRFLVTPGMEPYDIAAVESIGEVDMAGPTVLTDFINWSIASYPADRYALVLWDHGGGWMGLLVDDYSSTVMSVAQLGDALAQASADNGGMKLDLIGFDACLMGAIEVSAEVAGYGEYMVASEVTIPWQGWNYGLLLDALTADPSMTAEMLGAEVVDSYISSYSLPIDPYPQLDVTMSVTDLSRSAPLESAADALATELLADIPGYINYIAGARALAETYDDGLDANMDLYDFAYELSSVIPTPAGVTLTDDVMTALTSAVVYEDHWNRTGGLSTVDAHGLTIYFPAVLADYYSVYGDAGTLAFTGATSWDEFLEAYYAYSYSNSAPVIDSSSPAGDTYVDQGDQVTFSIEASDPDGNVLGCYWSIDGQMVQYSDAQSFLFNATDYSSGAHTVAVEVWDGEYGVSHSWTVEVNAAPVADAGGDAQVEVDVPFAFDGFGSYDDLGIVNYTWSFEADGSTVTLYGVSPSYTFTVQGVYPVTLNVTDASGLYDRDTVSVRVVIPDIVPPVADAGVDMTVLTGMTVTFDGTGSTDDVGVEDYIWTFIYNGSEVVLTGPAAQFVFWTPGSYTVTLNVSDSYGNYDTATVTVTVEPQAIPEFGSLLLPVLAVLAIFLFARARRGRDGP